VPPSPAARAAIPAPVPVRSPARQLRPAAGAGRLVDLLRRLSTAVLRLFTWRERAATGPWRVPSSAPGRPDAPSRVSPIVRSRLRPVGLGAPICSTPGRAKVINPVRVPTTPCGPSRREAGLPANLRLSRHWPPVGEAGPPQSAGLARADAIAAHGVEPGRRREGAGWLAPSAAQAGATRRPTRATSIDRSTARPG
jgi:hypothetical protein